MTFSMFAIALSRSVRSREVEGFVFAAASEVLLFLPNFDDNFDCSDIEPIAEEPSGKPCETKNM